MKRLLLKYGPTFIVIAFVLTSISLIYTGIRFNQISNQIRQVHPENTLWMSGRIGYAYRDFQNAIQEYRNDPSELNLQNVIVNLDLLWSSTTIFHSGTSMPFLRIYQENKEDFLVLADGQKKLDLLLEELPLKPYLRSTEILSRLKLYIKIADRINRYALQEETMRLNILREKQSERLLVFGSSFVLWSGLFLLVIWIIWRKYKQDTTDIKYLKQRYERVMSFLSQMKVGIAITNTAESYHFENESYNSFKGEEKRRRRGLINQEYEILTRFDYPNQFITLGEDLTTEDGTVLSLRLDVTFLQQEIEKLKNALLNHDNAVSAKADFLAMMSHEMRTPLNGVLGLLGLVLDGPLEPEQRGYILTARESAEILLSLIEDILDYSKIEAGKLEFENTDFSIHDLSSNVSEILAPRAYEKGIEIAWHVDPLVPVMMKGDPGRLRQILLNLAGNAVKFTEHGGVTIEIAIAADQGDCVLLSGLVSDTGIGIPYEAQDQMFGEFNQLDASYSRRFGGSGLGLSITRRLVEAMGGSIGVSSEPGRGSQFSFTIQVEKTISASVVGQQNREVFSLAPPPVGLQHRILVWAEEGICSNLLLHTIKTLGHQPTIASDDRLIEEIKTEQYHLILIDSKPARNEGNRIFRDVIHYIRGHHINIPVCLLQTSRNTEIDKQFLSVKPLHAVMQKPVNLFALKHLLDHLEIKPENIPAYLDDQQQIVRKEGVRILLVEDSATNRTVATAILKRAGYTVDWANDGAEAVKAMQDFPYNLVLMDISMPNMDGMEASRIIRSFHGIESRVPILAMTAHAMPGDKERFLAAGMDDYLVKPINAKLLLEMIAQYLPDPHSENAEEIEDNDEINWEGVEKIHPVNTIDTNTENNIEQQEQAAQKSASELNSPLLEGAQEQNVSDLEFFQKKYFLDEKPIVDETVISQMREDAGEEAIPLLIKVFSEEVPLRLIAINESLDEHDRQRLAREAHTLKSSSGSFGAIRLNLLAIALEQMARDGAWEDMIRLNNAIQYFAEEALAVYADLT